MFIRALIVHRKDVTEGRNLTVPVHSVLPPSVEDVTASVDIWESTNEAASTGSLGAKRRAPPPPERRASLKKETRKLPSKEMQHEVNLPAVQLGDQVTDHPVTEADMSADTRDSSESTQIDRGNRRELSPSPGASSASQRTLLHSPVSSDMFSGRELIDSVREKSVALNWNSLCLEIWLCCDLGLG